MSVVRAPSSCRCGASRSCAAREPLGSRRAARAYLHHHELSSRALVADHVSENVRTSPSVYFRVVQRNAPASTTWGLVNESKTSDRNVRVLDEVHQLQQQELKTAACAMVLLQFRELLLDDVPEEHVEHHHHAAHAAFQTSREKLRVLLLSRGFRIFHAVAPEVVVATRSSTRLRSLHECRRQIYFRIRVSVRSTRNRRRMSSALAKAWRIYVTGTHL